ncbi:MAG: hypothetical protein LIP77_10905 [Planctomycetes bacterium]|nr:hypothetical protein [Planctomycetota bacterium]
MQIESFFPGRLRIRSPLFTKQDTLDQVTAYVRGLDGIRTITGNPQTGSLTVVYDPSVITMPMLMTAKQEIENLEQGGEAVGLSLPA